MRERRKITNLILTLAAVGLGFFAQSRFRTDAIADALILYLLAAVLFVYANRGRSSKSEEEGASATQPGISTRQLGWGPSTMLRTGLALLALAGVCMLLSLRLFGRSARPTTIAWLLYVASLVLFVAAFWAMEFTLGQWNLRQLPSFDGVKILSRLWPPKTETVILIVILISAAFVRLYDLDSLPFGVWYDEAVNGLEAQRILDDPSYRPIYMRPTNSPAHFMFLISLSFKFFGVDIFPIRAVSAVFGMAMVIAAYLFGREFFDRRMALVLAFLIAISRWGVNFSRIGMYGITAPLFELLALYFLMRGLRPSTSRRGEPVEPSGRRSGRSLDFALGGIAMGFGACFYSAFYLFVPVVGLFLIHKAIVERGFVRRHHLGILVFIVAALLVFAPVGQFAWRNPQAFSDRTRVTSIFKDRTRAEAIEVVRQSAKQHLLMFNYRGDPNGRHNLPGQPMLDFVTSALFVLGLGYSLYRGLQPKYLLLVVWLLVMLCGGIFSLEFEAPQSLRAIGTMPAAYVLACVPLYLMAKEWDKSVRRWSWLPVAACCLLLAYTGWKNMHTYFQVQAKDFAVWNAFSTAETLTARRMAEMGPDYDFHVISLYDKHPVLRFLARNVTQYKRLETNATMPLRESGVRETVLFFDPERRPLFLEARRYYPGGLFEEFQSPYGGPAVLYSCRLTPGQIKDIQGLVGLYYQGSEEEEKLILERKDAQISFDWEAESPLPAPFSARWEGILYVPRYGHYNLGLMAPAEGRVHLDENLLLDEPGEVKLLLAKGNHALRVEAEGGDGRVDLYWQPPGEPPNPIPQQFLYTAPPVTNNGLLGRYYRGLEWAGEPALEQIDPSLALYFHVTLLRRPYTVEWTGKLEAPTTGTYGFGLESIDDSWLYVDGQPVAETHVPNQYREGQISLTAGWHDITVRYVDKSSHSHVNLYWRPPGGGQEIIPSQRLLPPQGAYPELVVHAPTPPPVPIEPQEMDLGQIEVWGGPGTDEGLFNEPRDIAVDKEGNVYVADTGNRRIQKFSSQGEFLLAWSGGEENFVEPLAVVVTSQGQVLVLDSEMGWVYRFNADGKSLGRFGGPEAQLFHPRGMAIDAQDNIYIADTGGCRIIKYDVQGNRLALFGEKGNGAGQLLEPTDVAIGPGGDLYVADTANLRIQHWDLFGRYQAEWAIPLASAYNGPHLALAADGSLFVTTPEQHQVRRYSSEGELLGQWGGLEQFRIPVGLTLDEAGNLYVADTLNHRVQKLETYAR